MRKAEEDILCFFLVQILGVGASVASRLRDGQQWREAPDQSAESAAGPSEQRAAIQPDPSAASGQPQKRISLLIKKTKASNRSY
ncbi:hypothetical protein SapgrDRAFT_0137 [Saprospira grandis DSM 2844]|uniref:Uncharacterized protein n=1 Tax=Saprospira grandis DSM 2844 TaxID=694433 RepID=J0XSJ7_9BACT|nr:hypothetical protein SapgrDRAFT_0137 [Saprospira grandis DSM 2844]